MIAHRYVVAAAAIVLSLALPANTRAQGTITGRVVQASTLRPLSGAQVSIPGSGIGALANSDGRFLLTNVPAGQTRVRVEIIGFAAQERVVAVTNGQATEADFQLETQALGLDEIVVTGTAGGVSRRAIGNVVSSMSTDQVLERTSPSSLQLMMGSQVPGVIVSVGNANVGSGGNVQIRGTNTLNLTTTPLLYIDGVRANGNVVSQDNGTGTSRMNDINPADIERIEIIKGPAAATLYGSEASNGVIQIITKKGALGAKAAIDLSVRQGGNFFRNAAARVPDNYGLAADGKTIIKQNLYTDEYAAGRPMFRTGYMGDYALSIRGGQEKLGYYLSGSYDGDHGYQFNNALSRTGLRSNLQLALSKHLDLSSDIGVIKSVTTFAQSGTSGVSGLIPMILWGSPTTKDTPLRGFMVGPPEVQTPIDVREALNRATTSVTATYRPTTWLTQRIVGGFDWTDSRNNVLYPKLPIGSPAFYAGSSNGDKTVTNIRDLNRTLDYNLTASLTPSPQLTSSTSFGVQYFARQSQTTGSSGNQMPTPAVTTVSSASVRTATETFVENKTFGLFLQETAGWHNQVFVTAAMRGDANSAFGKSFKAAYYPKLSGTWTVSDAPFWHLGFFDSFRLRSAWGKSGLQPDAFAAIRTYDPLVGPADIPAVQQGQVGNAGLKPEVGAELELGLDFSVLKNLASLEFTHYSRTTKDAIIFEPIAPSSGFTGTRQTNAGEISGEGWELKIDTNPIRSSSVQLTLGASGSINTTRVENLNGKIIFTGRGRWQQVEGFPVGASWTKYIATAQWGGTDGKTLVNVTCEGGPVVAVGGLKGSALPQSERGKFPNQPCDQAPWFYLGNSAPTRIGAINQSLTLWNQLTLSTQWVYNGDSRRFNTTEWYRDKTQSNSLRSVQIRLGQLDPIEAAGVTVIGVEHVWSERDDFFRLRDATANYNLPTGWVQSFGVSRASISVSARDMWYWVHPGFRASGMDPEAKRPLNILYGYQQTEAPLASSVVTTMRITF